MDISRTRVVLRERAVVDVLDLAVRFIAEHWAVYARLALAGVPLGFAASWLAAWLGGPLWGWAFAFFGSALAGAPFTLLASRLVFEDDVRLGPILGRSVRAFPQLAAQRAMTMGLGGVGLVLLFAPGVWVLAARLFVVEVLMLERAGLGEARRRSSRLVGRYVGAPILAVMLLFLVQVAVVLVADAGGRAIISALLEARSPEALWDKGWSALALLGYWLLVPYTATARFFFYLDVRTRTEGWDIQTRFAGLANRDEGVPSARRAA